ncbi:MAG: DUF4920 domain-containing protein [Bacteriovoracaceae bacterium]|nr:DUF4920 domain-containing protein [Bacteroidota bacterium]
MKKLFFISLITLLVAATAFSAGKKKYGNDLTVKEVTKISEIVANPDKFDGKRVLVQGPIVDVCKTRGCWIKIGSDKEFESVRFKVEDGVIVFPLEIKGQNASAEGIVSVKKYSVEEQIKSGEEHAKKEGTTFDPSSVKGTKVVLQINGEGAQVETK